MTPVELDLRTLSALAVAMPLADRLAAAAPVAAPAGDAPASRRLARWRQQRPFSDAGMWRARLRADGIDEATLLALLGEARGDLVERLGSPSWAAWLLDGADRSAPEPPPAAGAGHDSGSVSPVFLTPAAAPVLCRAEQRLRDDLRRLVRPGSKSPIDPEHLLDQLRGSLWEAAQRMLTRTLTLELHLANLRGDLPAGTAEERFAAFVASFSEPARRWRLFTDYPVLARQLTVAADSWHRTGLLLAGRIVADADAIRDTFAAGADPGQVVEVSTGRGDLHRNGQSVAIVRWSSGLVVVYKPRPLAVDVRFTRLVAWLNKAGLSQPLRTLTHLDRGDYGWVEYVAARPCADGAGIGRFYHRQGALLALFDLLRAGDMHAENVIAAGEQPVPIDLETLFQPEPLPDVRATVAEQRAVEVAASSVLQVGLLPTLMWRTRDGGGADLSGLGGRPGQRSPMALPVLAGVGTDAMRVRLEHLPLGVPDHRPVDRDAPLNLLDYADDLVAGYTEVHRLCRSRLVELLADNGPLAAFYDVPIRVLLRSTIDYSTLLWTGFHPDLLRDALERDRHFDFLWRRVAEVPALAACVSAERRDLWRGDIPYFATTAGGSRLVDSDGEPVLGIEIDSGLSLARRGLTGWDEDHLSSQLALIRGSVAAAAINTVGVVPPAYRLPPADRRATRAELVAVAEMIGDRLAALAVGDAHSAQWLGMNSHLGRNWSLGQLAPDLFNGLSGVALFLAQLSRITGEERHADLAHRALATVRSQLRRDMLDGLSGMAGIPGVCYALCRLSALLQDSSLVDWASEICAGLREAASSDTEYDIVAGSAGTIVALRLLHRLRPDGPAGAVIAAAADRLATTAEPSGGIPSWLSKTLREQGISAAPLAGLGHGVAGIAWALTEVGGLLGRQECEALAREAVTYERRLFDPGDGTWRDLRSIGDQARICAWCHGAVGIGLARLASGPRLEIGPEIEREIDAAIAASRRDGFGTSHCLCHGDSGTIELLLTAAEVTGRAELLVEAERHAARVVRSVRADGWMCGVPFGVETPSLMVGLSGIGYEMLRVAAPDQVPSVLTLAPAAT